MSTVGEKVYYGVIEEVINGVRDLFLDEGVDEQVLQELKLTWEKKLHETKVLDYGGLHKDSGGGSGTTNASSSSNSRSNSNQANNSTSRNTNSSRATNINRDSNRNQNQATTSVTVIQSPSTTLSSSQAHVNLHQSQQHTSIPPTNSSTQQQQQSKPLNPPPHLISSIGATSSRLLNYNPGNTIPHLIQYTAGQNLDGSKNVTIVPKNVALAYNPQTSGLTTVMSSSGAPGLALTPELAASILQQTNFNPGSNVINVTHNRQLQDVHFGGSSSNNQSSAINNGPTLQIQATTSNSMDQRTALANSRDSRPSTGCTNIVQLDGPNDSSEEEEEDEDDFRENDDDNDDDQNDDEHDYTGEEEEPLNSEDDVSDEDPHELFDTDNVVVCQYDKITRSRNKWKFHLKDGIMNLQGKDYVFQKAIGDAEW